MVSCVRESNVLCGIYRVPNKLMCTFLQFRLGFSGTERVHNISVTDFWPLLTVSNKLLLCAVRRLCAVRTCDYNFFVLRIIYY
jgi:hypothetical protein